MFILYNILATLLLPIHYVWLKYRVTKAKEDPKRLMERFGKAKIPRPSGKLIWMHGASIGESISLFPLIDRILEKKQCKILITTGTVTSSKIIAKNYSDKIIHQYLPIDSYFCINKFLSHWKPDLVIWTESELWPGIIRQASKRCKILLINARMSPRSFKKWKKFRFIIKSVFQCFHHIYAQSNVTVDFLHKLGAGNVSYNGNLKYLGKLLPANENLLHNYRQQIGSRLVLVCGSTHKGEEEALAKIIKKLQIQYPELLTIIVPRDIKRGKEIKETIKLAGLKVNLKSIIDSLDTEVFIADTIGELGIFYRLGNVVFVGGSLVPHGGQNILEPAMLNKSVVIGPHYFNFAEIVTELKEAKAISIVVNEEALHDELKKLLSDRLLQELQTQNAVKFIANKRTELENMFQEILSAIN